MPLRIPVTCTTQCHDVWCQSGERRSRPLCTSWQLEVNNKCQVHFQSDGWHFDQLCGRLIKCNNMVKTWTATRGGFRGGGCTRCVPPQFFAEIGHLTLCGRPRQKECTKSCKFMLKISIFLRFWGGTSPSDTPCPHRCQSSVSPWFGCPLF